MEVVLLFLMVLGGLIGFATTSAWEGVASGVAVGMIITAIIWFFQE